MIIFRQKEFAKVDTVADFKTGRKILRAPIEFIKSVEMMNYNGGRDIPHWVSDKCINDMIIERFIKKLNLSPQLAFSLAIEEDFSKLNEYFGVNTVNSFKLRFGNNIGYIEEVKRIVLTESREAMNGPKYDAWFKDPNHKMRDSEEYSIIFHFLGLALSGQLEDYKIDDPINHMYNVSNQEIDYSNFHVKDFNSIKDIVTRVLAGICGVPDSYSPIKRLKNYKI